jgi:hypothetical protein
VRTRLVQCMAEWLAAHPWAEDRVPRTGRRGLFTFEPVYVRTSRLTGDVPNIPVRIASAAMAVNTPFHL